MFHRKWCSSEQALHLRLLPQWHLPPKIEATFFCLFVLIPAHNLILLFCWHLMSSFVCRPPWSRLNMPWSILLHVASYFPTFVPPLVLIGLQTSLLCTRMETVVHPASFLQHSMTLSFISRSRRWLLPQCAPKWSSRPLLSAPIHPTTTESSANFCRWQSSTGSLRWAAWKRKQAWVALSDWSSFQPLKKMNLLAPPGFPVYANIST